MKQWLAIAFAWIVSLFTFWKLGEHNGKQEEEIKQSNSRSDTLARALNARANARTKWLSKHGG